MIHIFQKYIIENIFLLAVPTVPAPGLFENYRGALTRAVVHKISLF